jgi:hypothetical protein
VRRVLQRAEASNALDQISALASAVTTQLSETATDLPAVRRLHIDYAHSISIGVHKEKYFLLMTLDGIDFTFCSATVDRTEPESLIHEFLTLTRLKIDCIRYDGAAEFAKSDTFKTFCVKNRITIEETASLVAFGRTQCCTFAAPMLTGVTNKARVHGRNWILMGHVRSATMRHAICTVLGPTSRVTCLAGTLWWRPQDTMFWMYSFKLRKVVRLSDPRHFDHILPFLCPEEIPHRIDPSLPTTSARCTRRMVTRFNACRSVRACAFALQLRGSQSLSLLTLVRQMPMRGIIRRARCGGARCCGAG